MSANGIIKSMSSSIQLENIKGIKVLKTGHLITNSKIKVWGRKCVYLFPIH